MFVFLPTVYMTFLRGYARAHMSNSCAGCSKPMDFTVFDKDDPVNS